MLFNIFFLASFLGGLGLAHPGEHHNHARELEIAHYRAHVRRGLSICANKLAQQGMHRRAVARRQAILQEHSKPFYLDGRSAESVNSTSHLSSAHYNSSTPDSVVFSSNRTCALNPEGETGPYYIPGELIRKNLTESEPGVPLYLETQFINIETCEPIQGLYMDIWNCNSTGVYSGLVGNGNGNANDTSNLHNTALRGIQKSDADGVVAFQTIFPGHYSGRATHVHLVAHLNATRQRNGTVAGGTNAHIGQFFFDQPLIAAIEATYPYNTNTIAQTANTADRVFATETANTTTDPVLEYARLGPALADGLFAWAVVGVNVSAAYDPNYSWAWTANGSVAEQHGSVGGGGGSGGSGNGTVPSGSMSGAVPSGTPPS